MYIVIVIMQFLCYVTLYFPVKFFFRMRCVYTCDAHCFQKGVLITPNHQSRLDIFLVYAALPFRQFLQMLPVYPLVAQKYMDTWWKYLALTAVGCYPVKQGTKHATAALLHALDLLDAKKTVLLFPEGRVMKQGEVTVANPGIGYLALKRNTSIIPMYLTGFPDVTIKKLFLRKYHATIIVGKPSRYGNEKRSDSRKVAASILDNIYTLQTP